MPTKNSQEKTSQSPGAMFVFLLLWWLAIAAFLFVSFFYAVSVFESFVRVSLIVIIIVAVPLQISLLRKSLTIFLNHDHTYNNVDNKRTDGAALARSLFMVVGSIILSIILTLAYFSVVCG